MADMTKEEFKRQKSDAERRILELYRGQSLPPFPDFVSVPKSTGEEKKEPPKKEIKPQVTTTNNIFKFLNFSELLKSPDALLILGLIFLLMSDNADEKLILALVFIML